MKKDVQTFYGESSQALAWIEHSRPTARAREMIDLLSHADTEGLNPEDYDGPRWSIRLAELAAPHSPDIEAAFDLELTVCAMRYISAVRIGRVNPHRLNFPFIVEDKELDLALYLRKLLTSEQSLPDEIHAIEPPFGAYKLARQALLRYMELAKQDDGEKLPPSIGTVKRLGYYDHMPALDARLRQLGDMPKDAIVPARYISYDEPLISAVRHFQLRHGLTATGYLDPKTIDELNVPLRARVDQLRYTLERYRWISYDFTTPRVVVNLPELRLKVYDENDRVVLAMRVNVGDAYDQTPTLQSSIPNVIFRPYWYVPLGILREEVLPDLAVEPAYLPLNRMEVITRRGKLVTTRYVSRSVLQQLRAGSLILRERPGPENPLGLIKFDFPNQHEVYLHDTPLSLHFFAGNAGDISHGCIQVEHPAELARWLLRDQPEWTEDRVSNATLKGSNEFAAPLTKPVPILILYLTAVAEADGEVHFYDDIYGHDAKLKESLSKGYPYP